jgi:hypothetical protein
VTTDDVFVESATLVTMFPPLAETDVVGLPCAASLALFEREDGAAFGGDCSLSSFCIEDDEDTLLRDGPADALDPLPDDEAGPPSAPALDVDPDVLDEEPLSGEPSSA